MTKKFLAKLFPESFRDGRLFSKRRQPKTFVLYPLTVLTRLLTYSRL
ncbi:hypothetical protein SXCC_03797 [Gluconacetobacter sp. SXCC-1]|nr:hypothetical protein SXCC_03797 [Gluconacetobacter sp. SXCC-1]